MGTSGLTLIAEAATCHGGDLRLAMRMALEAKVAGATHVKYQHVDPNHFPAGSAAHEWYSRVRFTVDQWREVKAYCESRGIKFLCTPQTVQDFRDLVSIGIEEVKISSDNASNAGLASAVSNWNRVVYISTNWDAIPISWFQRQDPERYTMMLCTSEYPCPPEHAGLARLKLFGVSRLGFSDHTIGHEAALIALGLGARTFEKHFRLADVDLAFCGPDVAVSFTQTELASYFRALQRGLTMLGTGWPE